MTGPFLPSGISIAPLRHRIQEGYPANEPPEKSAIGVHGLAAAFARLGA